MAFTKMGYFTLKVGSNLYILFHFVVPFILNK